MSVQRERAAALIDLGRHGMAAEELVRALRNDPDDPLLHSLLAISLSATPERLDEALHEAFAGVALGADQAFPYYALSRVQWKRGKRDEAEEAARAAVALEPDSPELLSHLAGQLLDRRRFGEGLEVALRGVAEDPRHLGSLNMAASALSHLGRHDEAADMLDRALEVNPEQGATHAIAGWTFLRAGRPERAAEHFRQTLRLEPALASARDGLLDALKARNPAYRALVRVALRLPWLPGHLKWVLVALGVVAVCWIWLAVDALGLPHALALPLQAAAAAAVIFTWTAGSAFNLVLFWDPVGRHTLTRRERVGAVAMAATLAASAALGVASLFTDAGAGLACILVALFTIPVAALFRARKRGARIALAVLTPVLLVTMVAGIVLNALGHDAAGTVIGLAVGGMAWADAIPDGL